jgi:hypothetical protein
MAFIEERASQYDTWLEVTWSLDGTSVPARVFHWAGAWSGLALTPEVAVIVVANSVKPEGLALAQVRAGDDYHFDVNAPFEWPGFIEVSQEEVFQGSDDFWDRRWPYHVDHQELLAPDDHQDPG